MLRALAKANPRAIIGGPGKNYALTGRLAATDLLALYLRWFLAIGFTPFNALRMAKIRMILKHQRQDVHMHPATADTLAFRIWQPLEVLTPEEINRV
jgi:hypothetical protein